MTTIAKDIALKLSVAVVAIAMALAAFAPVAQAQTTEELQEMINELLAQIAELEGETSGDLNCTHFQMDHGIGSTGPEVMALQKFLNSDPDTRVAASGVGSAGMETDYYGALTADAVSKFQVKYRAEILTPLGLVNPTGYFGASSRDKANSMCDGTTPDGDEDEDGDSDEGSDDELDGEGSLEVSEVELDDASDDEVEEGSEDAEVAVVTLSAENGDIEVDRMTFTASSSAGVAEEEPWEIFESFSLWVDGDMIGEFEADDEDNYLDEDDGEFRFADLELIVDEDEEVEITLGATVMGGVDSTPEEWNFDLIEVRTFDADGVASDEDISVSPVSIEIVEEGEGDDLEINTSSEDPDDTTFVAEEDSNTEEMIFAFELDADDSDTDLELDMITLNVSGTAVDPDGTNLEEFLSDLWIEIDGETYDADDYDGNGNSEDVVFEIDGDSTIDAEESVTVMVYAEFDVDDDFTSATITAETVSVEAEGADDVNVSNTITGEEHDVITEGIVVLSEDVETSTETSGDNDDIGEFEIMFDVTAYEDDFYITDNAGNSSTTVNDGVQYTVETGAGGSVNTAADSATLTSTADEDTDGVFTVSEGETETFTLTVTLDVASAGQYRVVLDEVWYSTNTDGDTGAVVRTLTPASDYRTEYETIQAS